MTFTSMQIFASKWSMLTLLLPNYNYLHFKKFIFRLMLHAEHCWTNFCFRFWFLRFVKNISRGLNPNFKDRLVRHIYIFKQIKGNWMAKNTWNAAWKQIINGSYWWLTKRLLKIDIKMRYRKSTYLFFLFLFTYSVFHELILFPICNV